MPSACGKIVIAGRPDFVHTMLHAVDGGSFDDHITEFYHAVSMTLTSVGNPAWHTVRGVRFLMSNGPTLVTILVTHEAIDHIEQASAGSGEYLTRFNNHRMVFERAASAKHQRGDVLESGAVMVEVGDVKASGS